jgi:flagellar hook-length control protein FliK
MQKAPAEVVGHMQNVGPLPAPIPSLAAPVTLGPATDLGAAFATIIGPVAVAPGEVEPTGPVPPPEVTHAVADAVTTETQAQDATFVDANPPPFWLQALPPPPPLFVISDRAVGLPEGPPVPTGPDKPDRTEPATDAPLPWAMPAAVDILSAAPLKTGVGQALPAARVAEQVMLTPPVAGPLPALPAQQVQLPAPVTPAPSEQMQPLLPVMPVQLRQGPPPDPVLSLPAQPVDTPRVSVMGMQPDVQGAATGHAGLPQVAGMTVRVLVQDAGPMPKERHLAAVTVAEAALPMDRIAATTAQQVLRHPQEAPPAAGREGAAPDATPPGTMATAADAVLTDDLAALTTTGTAAIAPSSPQPSPPSPAVTVATSGAPIPLALVPQAVATALRDDPARQVELRLDPPELGSVRFQIDQRSADLVVHIIAERPETLDLMRRHSEQLLADLRQAGFAGASLNFGTSQGQGGQGGAGQGTAQNALQTGPAAPPHPSAFSTPPRPPPRTATGGLNLRL